MLDKIKINKEIIPYSFNIVLNDELFQFNVGYNKILDLFTIDLLKNNRVLVYGEPLLYGVPLFVDTYKVGFPVLIISPIDEAGNQNKISFEAMGKTIDLCILDFDADMVEVV